MSLKRRLDVLERAVRPKPSSADDIMAGRGAAPRWSETEALAVRDDQRAPHRLRTVAAACLRSRRLRAFTINDLV